MRPLFIYPLITILLLSGSIFPAFSQEDEYKNIPKRLYDQKDRYDDGDYYFPPKPKNKWALGLKAGWAYVSGDVNSRPGLNLGLDVRKALGHSFSLRLQLAAGQTFGMDDEASFGYRNHRENPWNTIYFDRGINQVDPANPNSPPVFYNYRMRYGDASIQAVVNMNNINFYRDQCKWNIYMALGLGLMGYQTRIDAGTLSGQNVNPYDFLNIPVQGDRKQTISALKNSLDGDYETIAENHIDETDLGSGSRKYIINPVITGGIGIQYRINSRIDLELEHRVAVSNDDLLDGQRWQEYGGVVTDGLRSRNISSLSTHFDNYNYLNLGINFRLGAGEESLWWSNPLTEVYSQGQEAREIVKRLTDDADNDGVPDLYDKEPDTPEGSPVDAQGMTLDSDGDGYPDEEDDEPRTPKGCDVDANGVALDSDNDDVPDCFDKEPNSPPGMYYDAHGVAVQMPASTGSGSLECENNKWVFYFDDGSIEPIEIKYFGHMLNVMNHENNRGSHIIVVLPGNSPPSIADRRADNLIQWFVDAGIDRRRFLKDNSDLNSNDMLEFICNFE